MSCFQQHFGKKDKKQERVRPKPYGVTCQFFFGAFSVPALHTAQALQKHNFFFVRLKPYERFKIELFLVFCDLTLCGA